ncbi:hypothetical protein ABW19_dt0209872 [Dactylella cylindrospora]|nr:hypothetical protein ABW19_dt0209872 [Dactylella cylindrospora]
MFTKSTLVTAIIIPLVSSQTPTTTRTPTTTVSRTTASLPSNVQTLWGAYRGYSYYHPGGVADEVWEVRRYWTYGM